MNDTALVLLEAGANVSAIATGIVAVSFYFRLQHRARDRRLRLETYLKLARETELPHNRNGQRTPMRIAADLSMTPSDVWDAAMNSDKIKKTPRRDRDGFASGVLFHFDESAG
jgi:hypothetical protein